MKKRKKGRSLSRTKDQRDALLNTQLVSLAEYQSITTTLAKAKELRPFAERMITHAKTAVLRPENSALKVSKMRHLAKKLPARTAKKLFEIAAIFKDRQGGYTRIIKLPQRKSDASDMALIEWVEKLPEEKKLQKKAEKKGKDKHDDKPKAKVQNAK